MKTATQKSSKADEETPMMMQYQSIKKDYPDSVLFFRMGDFYEMFNEDAVIAARILEITLTSRSKNKANPIPMCGIPHHSANTYIAKLIKSGKKVAICEQTEDPRFAKGLVKREVVRVVTPGTVLDDNLLDPRNHHFLISVHAGPNGWGLAALDVTTGLFKVTELHGDNAEALLTDELEKIDPKEILLSETSAGTDKSPRWIEGREHCIHTCEDWTFSHGEAHRRLLEHFKTGSLEGFGCEDLKLAVSAAGALIRYLQETQKSALEHINRIATFNVYNYILLDHATVRSL